MTANQILISVIGLFLLATGLMYIFHLKKSGKSNKRDVSASIGLSIAGLIIAILPVFSMFSSGDLEETEKRKSVLLGPDAYGPGLPQSTDDFEKAVKFYEKAAKLYDVNFPGFKDPDSAEYYIRKSIENYETAEALTILGQLKVQYGDMDAAVKDFNRAIELKPNFGRAYYMRASVYYIKSQMTEACNDWRKAAEYNVPNAADLLASYCN